MSELTVTLRGKTADKIRKLVEEQHFARAEDAIEEAIEALDASGDDIDTWLREVVVKRIDAIEADPSGCSTPDEVRTRLLGKE